MAKRDKRDAVGVQQVITEKQEKIFWQKTEKRLEKWSRITTMAKISV